MGLAYNRVGKASKPETLHASVIEETLSISCQNLLDIYRSYVRPILEYGAPVWNGALTKQHEESLEKIQKRPLQIISGSSVSELH